MQNLICSKNVYGMDGCTAFIIQAQRRRIPHVFFSNKLKNRCNKLFEYYGHECVQTFRVIYVKKIIFKRTYFQTFEKQYETDSGSFSSTEVKVLAVINHRISNIYVRATRVCYSVCIFMIFFFILFLNAETRIAFGVGTKEERRGAHLNTSNAASYTYVCARTQKGRALQHR